MENTSRQIGMMFNGNYGENQEDEMIYVAYNMHWDSHEFALPHLGEGMAWYEVVNSGQKDGFRQPEEKFRISGARQVTVEPRTIAVLIGKRETE